MTGRPPRTQRGRGALRGILVLVLVLGLIGGGLFVADRYLHDKVQRQVATRLQAQLGTPQPPIVEIPGEPFLLQVATQTIGTVHVIADRLGSANDTIAIEHADVTLTNVTSDDWFATSVAGHAEGTADLSYPTLQNLAGVPLRSAGGGRVQIEVSTTVFNAKVTAVITGTPQLDSARQTITLADPAISVANVNLPDFTAKALLTALLKPIPITGLPLGFRVTSLTADDAGVRAGIAGDNVELK